MAQPLGRQIVIWNACLLAPVFIVIGWTAQLTYREQLANLQQETQTMAVTVAAYLGRSLMVADGVAASLVLHPNLRERPTAALGATLSSLLEAPLVGNVLLADETGRVVTWARPPEPGLNDVPAGWLKSVADTGQPRISPLLTVRDHARRALVLGYPLTSASGQVIGVLGLQVPLELLQSAIATIPMAPQSMVTVSDEQHVVLARTRDPRARDGEAEGDQPVEGDPSTGIAVGSDGVERVFGNAGVTRAPWVVSVGIPTYVATTRTMPIYWRNFGIAVTVTLLTLALELFLLRRYVLAFSHLQRAAHRLAEGDFAPPQRAEMPSRELEALQDAFADMVAKLRDAQAALTAQMAEERRMREEVQSLQHQVIRQERLAAIGVLVSGVAHELNNPLQAILGFAELLQMRDGLPPHVRSDLALIQKESTRAGAIIKNLSRFARQQTTEPSEVRLSDVVASVVELRQRKLGEQGIELDVREASQAVVLAVFTELQQVLLNFVINAEQSLLATGRPGRIVIRTEDDGQRARLEVEDTGPGVPPEDEPRLFQPFFTTKPVGEGTGLGLSVSYGIIESHGGTIGYRRGTLGALFFFELPFAPVVAPSNF